MTTFDYKLVGKIGSMALVNKPYNDMNYNTIARVSRELKPGMIWVTSGATEIGRLDYINRHHTELTGDSELIKADYAAQGQSILMSTYRQFVNSNYSLRQILVEHQHFNDTAKRDNLKAMLLRAASQNAIPIINYNDAVNYEENRKWEIESLVSCTDTYVAQCIDNDETASLIANLVKSEYMLILTCVDGIYDDPTDAKSLVSEIGGASINEVLDNMKNYQTHCKGASRAGAGGAWAKLEYSKLPVKNGTKVIIANAKYFIKDILDGNVPRTIIGVR